MQSSVACLQLRPRRGTRLGGALLHPEQPVRRGGLAEGLLAYEDDELQRHAKTTGFTVLDFAALDRRNDDQFVIAPPAAERIPLRVDDRALLSVPWATSTVGRGQVMGLPRRPSSSQRGTRNCLPTRTTAIPAASWPAKKIHRHLVIRGRATIEPGPDPHLMERMAMKYLGLGRHPPGATRLAHQRCGQSRDRSHQRCRSLGRIVPGVCRQDWMRAGVRQRLVLVFVRESRSNAVVTSRGVMRPTSAPASSTTMMRPSPDVAVASTSTRRS